MLTRLERVQMTTTILEQSQVGPVLVQLKKRVCRPSPHLRPAPPPPPRDVARALV